MASDTLLEQRIQQIAATHGIPLDTVRTALAEFIEALHELEFKNTKPPALLQVYFSLGDKAAWHYMGLGMELLTLTTFTWTMHGVTDWNRRSDWIQACPDLVQFWMRGRENHKTRLYSTMNRTKLKNYAPRARRDSLRQ